MLSEPGDDSDGQSLICIPVCPRVGGSLPVRGIQSGKSRKLLAMRYVG
jgi:hypothetical protein